MILFKNTYSKLPERFFRQVLPARFSAPKLLAFNHQLASELGMDFSSTSDEELAQIFSGQKMLSGAEPLAMAYAGFQFGHASPSLGDGRALLLGEVNGFDIHLKGSGQTPFSRCGDGRSALGPVIREYIVSEAMNSLGVPTTRALAAVATGEAVYRQNGPEPGGVFTRVAPSHIRVGTFQYFSFRDDHEAIEILLDYTIRRHYPALTNIQNLSDRAIGLLKEFAERQGELIAHWSSLGFIHGVMNTDNCALAGITIDYGPCAFMDEFKFQKVFSSIDENGRYSFFNQLPIIQWNILRLADCLLPLIDGNQQRAIERIENEIIPILHTFKTKRARKFAQKLGINDYQDQDESLVMEFLNYLERESLDFTQSFRNLPSLFEGDFKYYHKNHQLEEFIEKWKNRVSTVHHLNQVNPLYIPRNHQIQKAIDDIYDGDKTHFDLMNKALQKPFEEQAEMTELALPPRKEEVIHKTFCGT